MIVPVVGLPPTTLAGLRVKAAIVDGLIVKVIDFVTDPSFAEILASCWLVTPCVVISKVAEVVPAGTETVTGTEASLFLLDTSMVIPPVGAGDVSVNVPVTAAPPMTFVGESVNAWRTGASTFRSHVLDIPFDVAVMTTGVSVMTAMVLISNVAFELFWAIVTVGGTVTAACPLTSCTTMPPA